MECTDFLEFQEHIKKLRDLDDKIIYMLNTTVPTDSFRKKMDPAAKCKELYGKFKENYGYRESSIKRCISESVNNVGQLRSNYESNSDNVEALKALKKEQVKIRMLKTELGVEEVIKERTLKLYYERCRAYYKPAELIL